MKILITGGHYSSALAVIDKLRNHNIIFVGRKYSLDSENSESLEYKEIKKRNIKFINLLTGKLNRELSLSMLVSLVKIPLGFFHAFKIIWKEKPDRVFCFGSYVAFPIALISWLFQIPIFIHEQTISPGLTNKITALFAKKIFISFPESYKYFPTKKTILTGNPVRESILNSKNNFLNIKKTKPVIFVVGGSLGSHSINKLIIKLLPYLLKKYIVVQQTGSVKKYNDFEEIKKIIKLYPNEYKSNFYIKKDFLDYEIANIYSIADIVISRSGANTLFELVALKKPSVLIPLPWSVNEEQLKHAKILKKAGVGEIFYQNQDCQMLSKLIDKIIENLESYKKNFKNINYIYKKDAAEKIIKEILNI